MALPPKLSRPPRLDNPEKGYDWRELDKYLQAINLLLGTTADSAADSLYSLAHSANVSWPVGSIFIGSGNTNPATLLGFGTWAAVGTGATLGGVTVYPFERTA